MITSRYTLLSFCLALAVTLIACEGDTIIVGPTAEGIQVTELESPEETAAKKAAGNVKTEEEGV